MALDTNVLVRYLVRDDAERAKAARSLRESLTSERPGFVCLEVIVELTWVSERACGYSRDQIATVPEQRVATKNLVIGAADDVARSAFRYRPGSVGFSDLMILAAAARSGGLPCTPSIRRRQSLKGSSWCGPVALSRER